MKIIRTGPVIKITRLRNKLECLSLSDNVLKKMKCCEYGPFHRGELSWIGTLELKVRIRVRYHYATAAALRKYICTAQSHFVFTLEDNYWVSCINGRGLEKTTCPPKHFFETEPKNIFNVNFFFRSKWPVYFQILKKILNCCSSVYLSVCLSVLACLSLLHFVCLSFYPFT